MLKSELYALFIESTNSSLFVEYSTIVYIQIHKYEMWNINIVTQRNINNL